MAPQPVAQTDAQKEAAARKAEAEAAQQRLASLTSEGGTESVRIGIARAVELERRRADLMEAISNNRLKLRLAQKDGEMTDDQTAWLHEFYPDKEKGDRRSKAQIEATRKAKDAARRRVAATA